MHVHSRNSIVIQPTQFDHEQKESNKYIIFVLCITHGGGWNYNNGNVLEWDINIAYILNWIEVGTKNEELKIYMNLICFI